TPVLVDGGDGTDSLFITGDVDFAAGTLVGIESILVANGVLADFSNLTDGLKVTSQSVAGGGTIIHGGAGANAITAGAGHDDLYGGGGADRLYGGKAGGSPSTLIGLGGDDLYYVNNPGDLVLEAAGGGNDRVLAGVSYGLDAGQEIEMLTTQSSAGNLAINLTGNEFAQKIVGNAGANTIDGRGGADLMEGLGGDDLYYVDNAGDRVLESIGGGYDRVLTTVDYILAGSQEIELLSARNLSGIDPLHLTGNSLTQRIVGNAGANTLDDGGGGGDTLQGLGGDDTYYVRASNDHVIEASNGGYDQ